MRIVVDMQPCQNGSRHRGIGRYAMSMVRAMVESGRNHEFIIALNRSFPDSIADIRRAFDGLLPPSAIVTYSVPPMATAADPFNAWRNRAAEMVRAHFLESLSPDIVFIPSLFEGFWDDTIVSVERDAPYLTVVTLHDLIPLEDPARHLGGEHDRAAYFRRLNDARHADLLLAVSRYAGDDAIAKLGIADHKVVVAYGGVDDQFRAPAWDAAQKAALLEKYGISRPYVLTASPLEPRKNIEGLIAGYASMAKRVRERHQLVLAGKMDGFAQRYIHDLARGEGLDPETIVLPGFVSDADLPALYHYSSTFAFPSFSEGFGLPLLEAMACGAPVVGSSRTSIPEVVGRVDLAPDPANIVEIGQAIERILTDRAFERQLRDFGPRRAAQFTWEKSAVVALDALEQLWRDNRMTVSAKAPALDPVTPTRMSMALLTMDVPAEHRLAGLNNALAAALADKFDLTIITTGRMPTSEWLRANCAIRNVDWFETHGDQFDHILYSADLMADAAFRRLMRRQKGDLMLAARLGHPGADTLTGRRLFDGAELAMFEASGFGGLSRVAANQVPVEAMVDLLVRDLADRADSLYVEADSAVDDAACRMSILPIALSDQARQALCDKVGLPAEAAVIVAVTQDDDAATRVIQHFRMAVVDMADAPALVVFCKEDTPQRDGSTVSKLVSGIIRVTGDLDALYCGLLSAADVLIMDGRLPEAIRARIEIDCPAPRLCPMEALDKAMLIDMVDRVRKILPEGNITGASNPGAVDVARQISVLPPKRHRRANGLSRFIARLPADVRGRRPDGNDLAKVAVALARNEAHAQPPQIYIDVTAFAKPDPTHRLDRVTKDWLEAVFQRGGNRVKAVYAHGDNFVVSNQFAAHVCNIANSCLRDHLLRPQIGDHILGSDLLHSFAKGSFDLLRAVRNDGVALDYIILDSLAFQRDALRPLFAHILMTWIEEATPTNGMTLAGLSVEQAKAHSSEWTERHTCVQALNDAHIPVAVLDGPALLGDSSSMPDARAHLPATVVEAIERWDVERRKPLSLSRGGTHAADLGHVVAGHILGSYSLAIINRMLARSLEASFPGQARFLAIETDPIDHTEGVPADEKPLMIELATRTAPDEGNEVVISHHYPVIIPSGSYRLMMALFFWEESAVPHQTVQLLAKSFDAIISPARTVTNALLDSGLPIPIATIGQPVDIEPYQALASARRARGKQVRFLHVSSCFKRKGIDVLLEAWAKAFTAADPVCLIIKTFPNPHNDVEQQLADLGRRYPDLATVEIINRDVEREELLQFYADADVMVLPSRGEGYNLPALEAMASGLPLIVTGHGGQRDFCSEREARLIDYRFARSESHVSGHHSLWVEPDVDDLAAALQEQADPDQAAVIEERRQRALAAAARESDKMAWLHRYTAMVENLLDRADRQKARVAWVSTWGVQCGIAQYSQYLIDHFSPAAQREMTILCDHRTARHMPSITRHIPCWAADNVPKIDDILKAADDVQAEALVIQHQDGLLSWDQLGRMAFDDRLAGKVTVVVLHNAGNMVRASAQELTTLLEGLGKFSRVLVHNIADMNFLLSMGLKHNIGLLPHGAFAPDQAPWPKRFSQQDAPIIGCHGFFFQHKGIDKLIRAAAILRQEWPNLRLRLVNAQFPGEGHQAYISECKALAQSLGVYDAIEWHQSFMPIEQVNSLLSDCDIIALPYSESTDSASGAVRVSLASMVPLVATRVKIFAELGDAAAWADNNEPEVLADVIAELLRSPEMRRTVQAAMHEWLHAHDWSRVAGMLEGMIQGLVQEKRLHWDTSRMQS
ncbi:glycosyltransferase involved in cell wall biosynthesis [Sphingobium xenophagum]|uniref:Glycosyltransferase involved in cell wall biosynthesis n=1 Tax=Sphingobium xenophagum TaxID=121428 RepID=A0ABU1X041_SPHXE|nr:glycosyltransferase [Sphingobium xenophagum]MDR7154933.1 glycosyltransferase involved in cell wall biosynthesis [Sphingobium xenophagum]